MALTNVTARLTAAELAREPRSLGVIAWFDGNAQGSTGRHHTHFTYPRRLTRSEEGYWREGFADGRRERVCHSWHGFTPCDGDHPGHPRNRPAPATQPRERDLMARDHARFQTAVWNDPDFRKLDQGAQHVYFMLASSPDLSYCGNFDFIPGRMTDLCAGLTEPKIQAAVRKLERHKYVVVDRKTHELLVRSFIRHDKILARRNMGHACARALGNVHSQAIRDAVLHELARLWLEDASRDGWPGFKDYDPDAYAIACGIASDMERSMA